MDEQFLIRIARQRQVELRVQVQNLEAQADACWFQAEQARKAHQRAVEELHSLNVFFQDKQAAPSGEMDKEQE